MTKAIYAAALRDPDVLRAHASLVSITAMPEDVLAEPAMFERVIALGANAPRYPIPGATRAELLATVAGGALTPQAPIESIAHPRHLGGPQAPRPPGVTSPPAQNVTRPAQDRIGGSVGG
jgi:hypothetical protein